MLICMKNKRNGLWTIDQYDWIYFIRMHEWMGFINGVCVPRLSNFSNVNSISLLCNFPWLLIKFSILWKYFVIELDRIILKNWGQRSRSAWRPVCNGARVKCNSYIYLFLHPRFDFLVHLVARVNQTRIKVHNQSK